MSERKISIPPPGSSFMIGGSISFASVTAWLFYMLMQLQTGQARIEERLKVVESRLRPAPYVGAMQTASGPRQR